VLDAGIVDEDVEPAEFSQSRFDHLGDRVRLRHVGGGIVDANAVILGDAFACRLDLLRLAEAVQHHVGARAGQRARDAEPDAAGRAGDERDFALERGGDGGLRLRHGDVHGLLPPWLEAPVLGWTPRFFSQDDASDRTQT